MTIKNHTYMCMLHTYIHTYIHRYIHAYICTHVHTHKVVLYLVLNITLNESTENRTRRELASKERIGTMISTTGLGIYTTGNIIIICYNCISGSLDEGKIGEIDELE